jgi:hypothetical protein
VSNVIEMKLALIALIAAPGEGRIRALWARLDGLPPPPPPAGEAAALAGIAEGLEIIGDHVAFLAARAGVIEPPPV